MQQTVKGAIAFVAISMALSSCGGGDAAAGNNQNASGDAANPQAAVLRFSAIPDQDETFMREKFTPIAAYLTKELGVPCEFQFATTYDVAVDLFKNGDVQLVWFGGLSGAQARAAVPGARAIAQGAADPKYYSYFIANASTGLEKSDSFPMGIQDKKFTFGAAGSTSGRLMPEYFIRKNTGKSPAEFFGYENNYAGNHDKTCELVEAGTFDVGVVNYKVYDRRVKDGKTDPAKCKVIWQTPFYADYNFTAHPALETMFSKGFTDKLQKALVGMTDPELLSAFPRDKMIPAKNEEFEAIAELARELGMLR